MLVSLFYALPAPTAKIRPDRLVEVFPVAGIITDRYMAPEGIGCVGCSRLTLRHSSGPGQSHRRVRTRGCAPKAIEQLAVASVGETDGEAGAGGEAKKRANLTAFFRA